MGTFAERRGDAGFPCQCGAPISAVFLVIVRLRIIDRVVQPQCEFNHVVLPWAAVLDAQAMPDVVGGVVVPMWFRKRSSRGTRLGPKSRPDVAKGRPSVVATRSCSCRPDLRWCRKILDDNRLSDVLGYCTLAGIHMLPTMRTTLILDDTLVIKAKQVAAQDHRSLSDVVNQALRDHLTPSTRVREAAPTYRALTFGDPAHPVAMEPEDLAKLDAQDDRMRLGY